MPSIDLIIRMAKILDVPISALTDGELSNDYSKTNYTIEEIKESIISQNVNISFSSTLFTKIYQLLLTTILLLYLVFLGFTKIKYNNISNINCDNINNVTMVAYTNEGIIKKDFTLIEESNRKYFLLSHLIVNENNLSFTIIATLNNGKCVDLKKNNCMRVDTENTIVSNDDFFYLYIVEEGIYNIELHFNNNLGFVGAYLSE